MPDLRRGEKSNFRYKFCELITIIISIIQTLDKLKNIPALKAAIALSAGIIAGAWFEVIHFYVLIGLTAVIILCLFVLKKYSENTFTTILFLSLIILFGAFRAGLDFHTLPENSIAHIPDTPEKEKYKITGIINEIPDMDSNRVRFRMDVTGIMKGSDTIEVEGEIIASIYKSRYRNDPPPQFKAGDKVMLTGRLVTPWGERNPGEFDYRNYLRLHDIHKSMLVFGYENAEYVSGGHLNFVEQNIVFPAKYFATNIIERNMSGDEGEYLKGLVTGQRNDISAETKDAFIKTGVMHLIAVSGLNVAYVIIIITVLLGAFRIYFKKRAVIAIGALIFYCVFTGSSPSIVRATIMGILLLIAYESEMKTNFYNIAGFSALVILIFDTKQLFDPGFILSYTAVLSMVFCYERFKPALIDKLDKYEWRYKRYLKYVMILLVTTLAAQVGVLPVAGSYFEKISVISIVTNLVVVPLANMSLAIGFMQILAALFSEYLSSVIAAANTALLSFQLWFIKLCASWDFAYVEVYRFDLFNILMYFAGLVLLITMSKRNYRFRLTMAVLIIAAVILHNAGSEEKFRASFLDTGTGQCTVIETPDGRTILIDCGTKTETYDSGERTIIPYLKRTGVERIDALIITGTDRNRTGGMEHVLGNFPVTKVIKGSEMFFEYDQEQALKRAGVKVEETVSGDVIDQVENMRIYFLAGAKNDEFSVKVVYGNFNILFSGGIGVDYGEFLDADILRTGSKADENILKQSNPQIVITTDEIPGSHRSIPTNREGAVIIESDGESFEMVEW